MFHAKHFCPIGPENLSMPHTYGGFERRGIAQKFGILGGWMGRSPDGRI
jgi:hypothetical protein